MVEVAKTGSATGGGLQATRIGIFVSTIRTDGSTFLAAQAHNRLAEQPSDVAMRASF